jgi:hypothetical protein
MKKLLLLLLFFPLIVFGQDVRNFSSSDIIINQLLQNTFSFIEYKNTPKIEFRFYLTTKKSSINWNDKRFCKWQILDEKAKIIKQ